MRLCRAHFLPWTRVIPASIVGLEEKPREKLLLAEQQRLNRLLVPLGETQLGPAGPAAEPGWETHARNICSPRTLPQTLIGD